MLCKVTHDSSLQHIHSHSHLQLLTTVPVHLLLVSVPDPKPTPARITFSIARVILEAIYAPDEV